MSGGSFDYAYRYLSDMYEGQMEDADMNELIKDVCEVLHDLEWWHSGDIIEDDYRKTVAKFKSKWFNNYDGIRAEQELASELGASVANIIKDALPQMIEISKDEWIEFADYVARNVVNEDFSEDVDIYAEVLCRKLVKLGLVKLDGDTYKYCEEASKRIGSRYYGPDICSKCAHRNDLMSKVREEPSIFCEHWGLKVNSFDHCSNFEEVKHD